MVYVFDDDYELDLQRYELRYAGKQVKLEPQVFNLLVYLIRGYLDLSSPGLRHHGTQGFTALTS